MHGMGLMLLACFVAADAPRFEASVAAKAEPVVGELSALPADLIELRRVGAVRPMPPWDRPHLLLANGDRWPGQVLGIADDKLRFAADFGNKQELTIPLSAVVAVWLTPPRAEAEPKASDLDLAARKRSSDELTLINGDVVRGTIVSLEKGVIAVDTTGGTKKLPVERVAAISLSSDLTRIVKPKGTSAHVVSANGARVTLTETMVLDGRLVGKSATGQTVRLLLADVVSVSMVGGRSVYLSELKAIQYEHTPYLNLTWPLTRDRNTAGGWMRLGGETYDRGIGMHSQSVVAYAVPTGATRFESWVGLDAVAGVRGRVTVVAKVDSRDVFGPVELSGGQPGKRVLVALKSGAKELSLHVDFGAGADVQDHVNWADARFVGSAMSRP